MLWSEEAVRANIRNREGKRVFFLKKGDQLTSGAKDWLARERIDVRPGEQAKVERYRLLNGAYLPEKPEHMTHLYGDVLVEKSHPRIVFRGKMDSLQGFLILAQLAKQSLTEPVGEILALARRIVGCEVLEEPLTFETLCGLTEKEQRQRSHFPQDYYSQPHFQPAAADGEAMARLNICRCSAREAELAAAAAFTDREGRVERTDILQALNRMSSMLYLLMIEIKAGKR